MRLYDEVEIAHAYKELGYDEFVGKESGLYFACEGREDLVDLEDEGRPRGLQGARRHRAPRPGRALVAQAL